jgi:predicted patatin/cPLA2 family phospholipase
LASNEEKIQQNKLKFKISKLKSSSDNYKELYEKSINRELMYIEKINELEKLLNKKNSFSINNEKYGQIL